MMQTKLSEQLERNVTSRCSQRNFSYFDRSYTNGFRSQQNLDKDISREAFSNSPAQRVTRFRPAENAGIAPRQQ